LIDFSKRILWVVILCILASCAGEKDLHNILFR